ncbi:hypothetical protein Tco_1451676 [Tanacetum coccineum]
MSSAEFKVSSFLLAASAGFERGLSVDRTQEEVVGVLKKNFRFMPGAHSRLAEASPLMAMTDYPFLKKVSDCASHPLSAILQLKPKKLARSEDVSDPKDTRVSPPIAKESIMTPVCSSLGLPSNDVLFSSATALGHNEEWVNVMVDTPYNKMADGVVNDKPRDVFMQGVSHTVSEDVGSSLAQGQERVSFGPNDVVVALSVGEKDNGSSSLSFPITALDTTEEVVTAPSGV